MCGIYGYIGRSNRGLSFVTNGLKRLEYRGYDSWGIAFTSDKANHLDLKKQTGSIADYQPDPSIRANIALGHTRWATHGGVTVANAHPHLDPNRDYALVHNGIVENVAELEQTLANKPNYSSETDSERLLYWLIEEPLNLEKKLIKKPNLIQGMNSFVLLDNPNQRLIGVHLGSPMVVGKAKTGYVIASDSTALGADVSHEYYLEKGDLVILNQKTAVRLNQNKKFEPISFTPKATTSQKSSLNGYPHFMLKEIHQQPQILTNLSQSDPTKYKNFFRQLRQFNQLTLVGCGSAYHAAMFGQYQLAKVGFSSQVFIGSEYDQFCLLGSPTDLSLYISQSGETADLISTVEQRQALGLANFGIINRQNSTLERMIDKTLMLGAGIEMSVVSTKAFMTQMAVLYILAQHQQPQYFQKVLAESASCLTQMLTDTYLTVNVYPLVKKLLNAKKLFILGKGQNYPLALEMALKLKEAALMPAEAFAGGELKHGVLALVEAGVVCLVLASESDDDYAQILSNANEVKARGGYVVGLSQSNQPVFDYHLKLLGQGQASVFGLTLLGQLLAYYTAVALQLNPDKPRNLAKSVTVK